MGLFGFFTRGRRAAEPAWHTEWERAVASLDADAPPRLRRAVAARAAGGEDVELEEEMLQALEDVLALELDLSRGAWPVVETSHRVAAGERTHFSVPVSMPDEAAQPTGRLLLTTGRAAFAGGARTPAVAWHAAREVIRMGRDILFVSTGREEAVRFRCNSFSDAVCGTAIARRLMRGARRTV
jgi:hypothetical protein